MVNIKRAYEKHEASDGRRILVDRLWPRGISKEHLDIDAWYKDIAPSNTLRKWFSHAPARWEEFTKRYIEELKQHTEILRELKQSAENITLIYSAKDPLHNNAVVLKQVLDKLD